MQSGFIVTGTDTGIGKTLVSAAFCHAFTQQGMRVAAMKPVASGCEETVAGLRNADALTMARYCDPQLSYDEINPVALKEACAPHIAAQKAGVKIDMDALLAQFARLAQSHDVMIVEGVGGWHVPINESHSMVDLFTAMRLPVILVVGMRLGCLNHTLLTQQAILAAGLPLAGWVANHCVAHFANCQENIDYLQAHLGVPLIAEIPYQTSPDPAVVAGMLTLPETTYIPYF
jgi:dethiobiotin synthetase